MRLEKQTTIYLSEQDIKRLEKIKDLYDTTKTNDVIKSLIKEEAERIAKYQKII